jgi:uncharacterized zinc-type alcohol dehydrogenase-like protein
VTAIAGYAALEAKAALVPFSYEPGVLAPYDVELEVTHCGLCYSDIHLVDNDWKKSTYPFIPGHEVVGRVIGRGAEVTHLELGARVGVGWQRSACLHCELCLTGHENLCPTQTATCVGHHGGLAERMIADARFALPIPDALDSAAAAPLLCGGVTVFSPMRRFGVSGTSRVGVIGIGGLGHMALAILKAMGAEIVAFTSTPDKQPQAKRMGAHHCVTSNDIREIRKLAGTLDLILSTVHARLDYITYLQALRPNGVLCMLGGGTGLIQLSQHALLGQRSLTTGEIGTRAAITELLAFAARHGIAPQIEVAAMADSQLQIDRLRQNAVRYRAVLENR